MVQILTNSFVSRNIGIANELLCEVSVSRAATPENMRQTPKNKYWAVWDTGATHTAISAKVVEECGLQPIGITEVETAGGRVERARVFLINLYLPNQVIRGFLQVTECSVAGQGELLIGMDVINGGDFAVSNFEGKTTFTYRVPSIEEFDFTTQPPPPDTENV